MSTQVERPIEAPKCAHGHGTFGFLVAGLGIGAALSIFLAPKSGEETRKWISGKCLDAVDAANKKVRESRMHVKEIMDRNQQRVAEVVAARRAAMEETKEGEGEPILPTA